MTRILLLSLLTGMLALPLSTQTDQDDIRETLEEYFKAVEKKDHAGTLEFIYPKFFELYPKQMMLDAMKKMDVDTAMSIKITDASAKSISKTMEIEKVNYALVNYTSVMTMIIHTVNAPGNKTEEEMERVDFTYEILKEKYGTENISYDRKSGSMNIKVNSSMYAIKDPAYSGWKFLEKKEGMEPVMEKLLPKQVLQNL